MHAKGEHEHALAKGMITALFVTKDDVHIDGMSARLAKRGQGTDYDAVLVRSGVANSMMIQK